MAIIEMPKSRVKDVGNRILAYLDEFRTSLSLVSMDWLRDLDDNPATSYPPNPYVDCPRVDLRGYSASLLPGPPADGQKHKDDYTFYLFYKIRQLPGEDWQEKVWDGLNAMRDKFTQHKLDAAYLATPGYKYERVFPGNVFVHPQIRHEWGRPENHVAVGELQIVTQGWIVAIYDTD